MNMRTTGGNPLAPALVLYGRDGFRAACKEHLWMSPILRSTFNVAAADALVHLKTEHESKPGDITGSHGPDLPCLKMTGQKGESL